MSIIIAFLSGIVVCLGALAVPHARNHKTSIDEFEDFQRTLATINVARTKKRNS